MSKPKPGEFEANVAKQKAREAEQTERNRIRDEKAAIELAEQVRKDNAEAAAAEAKAAKKAGK